MARPRRRARRGSGPAWLSRTNPRPRGPSGPASALRRDGGVAFDPLAALTDTHRLAIETAQASFRSFARAVGDGAGGGGSGPGGWRADADDDGQATGDAGWTPSRFADLRRTVTRSLDLYLELAERLMDTATRSLEDTLRARGVTATAAGGSNRWTPVRPSRRSPARWRAAPIWLHNMTPDPMTAATFLPTDLTAHDGSVLPAACLTVDPPSLAESRPGQRVGRP